MPNEQEANTTLPPGVPPEAAAILNAMGYLDADTLRVGDYIPPLLLTRLDTNQPARIGGADNRRPTVLIFGSYT